MTPQEFAIAAQNGLLGQPQSYGGLLDEQAQGQARNSGLVNFGASLLAGSAPSQTPFSLGRAIGQSILAGRSAQAQSTQDAINAALLNKQITDKKKGDLVAVVDPVTGKPTYKYANTAEGMEPYSLTNQGLGAADLQLFNADNAQRTAAGLEPFKTLTDWKRAYTDASTQTQYTVQMVNGVPSLVAVKGPESSKKTPTALTTQQDQATGEASVKGAVAGAEQSAREAATTAALPDQIAAKAQGEITAALQKKGASASSTMDLLDLADPLIDTATGSASGAVRDKVTSLFGEAGTGAQSIARLKVIQAGLMLSMPRMEGPQSDKDVQLYRDAAGQIGDPTTPANIKKAAVATIRDIQSRNQSRADKPESTQPKVRKYNPATGKIE